MLSFLTEPANLPFSASLAVMILLVLLEAAAVLLGGGFSEFLDAMVPDLEMDVDVDLPDSAPSALIQVLTWFRVGEVPALMLLLVALTAFGLSGLVLQAIVQAAAGKLLPPLLSVIPSCFVALSMVRALGGLLGKWMPKDETTAVSEQTLIGRSAMVLAGTARCGHPVQAKVWDEHQKAHYVMVEPAGEDEVLAAGENATLISRQGAVFKATRDSDARP